MQFKKHASKTSIFGIEGLTKFVHGCGQLPLAPARGLAEKLGPLEARLRSGQTHLRGRGPERRLHARARSAERRYRREVELRRDGMEAQLPGPDESRRPAPRGRLEPAPAQLERQEKLLPLIGRERAAEFTHTFESPSEKAENHAENEGWPEGLQVCY